MRRGSLLLIGIASAVATLVSLNVIFGRSWNYYGHYREHYCNECYHNNVDKNNQRNPDDRDPDK